MRYGYTYLGFTEPTLCRLVPGLVAQMGGQFPELKAQQGLIEKVIEEEEASFLRTLATGINLLDGVIARTKSEVDFQPTYDNARKEPTRSCSTIPTDSPSTSRSL